MTAAKLTSILKANPIVWRVIEGAARLPGDRRGFVGGGAVTQSVWNDRFGHPLDRGLKDIDVVYFDGNLSPGAERSTTDWLQALVGPLNLPLDVKNQSRVHLWYEQRFGILIEPFERLEDVLRTWPSICAALAVGLADDGTLDVIAPFGLEDLFAGVVRPNKRVVGRAVYEAKVERWRALWPGLDFWEWDRTTAPQPAKTND